MTNIRFTQYGQAPAGPPQDLRSADHDQLEPFLPICPDCCADLDDTGYEHTLVCPDCGEYFDDDLED